MEIFVEEKVTSEAYRLANLRLMDAPETSRLDTIHLIFLLYQGPVNLFA